MEKLKNACLIGLWALLAYRVYTLIAGSEVDRSELIVLALFAWLGGIVTGRLMEKAYQFLQGWYLDLRAYRQN